MFDGNDDKQFQRNQIIAILLMVVLVVVWTQFFLPEPPPRTPATQTTRETREGEAPQAANPFQLPTLPAPSEAASPESAPESGASGTVVLPPVAEPPSSPAEDEVPLANASLELVFTRVGARLKRATVELGKDGADSIQLIPRSELLSDAESVYPMGLLFSDPNLGDMLNYRRWEIVTPPAAGQLAFEIEIPGYARIRKSFALVADTHVLDVSVSYTNLGTEMRLLGLDRDAPAFSLYWGPNVSSGDLLKGAQQNVVWRKDGANIYNATSKFKMPGGEAWYNERVLDPGWAAVCSAYFTVALKPEFELADAWYHGTPSLFRVGIGAPRTEVGPGQSVEYAYKSYVGPRGQQALAEAWPTLDTSLAFFTSVTIMDQFAKLLLTILVWFHDHVAANYGLAIIFLTVLVRVVMFPLTWKSMLSMRKMSLLAPEMEKIKQECKDKDDQQELQKRMMELYRERGVSPLGGCLPMLLQMPVFIALYRMLWSAYELRRAPFVGWIQDLSEPDRFLTLPFSIPIPFTSGLDSLNLLPIFMALAMVASTKLMPMSGPMQTPQQKTMMTIMPVFFSLITYNMASGLNLYILVSTLLGIAQNYLMRGVHVDAEAVKAKKPGKPRHFYDVVRAKQREMNKEIRKQKQRSRSRKGPKDRD